MGRTLALPDHHTRRPALLCKRSALLDRRAPVRLRIRTRGGKVKPIVFDYFCGEGGISAGWVAAGYTVVGIDNDPARLENYPYESVLGDAFEHMLDNITVPAIRLGSPTCTGYSRGTAAIPDRFTRYPRLIAVTREIFASSGMPYIIENVADARDELFDPVLYCARHFGLGAYDVDGEWLTLDRHRLFESGGGFKIEPPPHPKHAKPWTERETGWAHGPQIAGVYSGARRDKWEARYIRKGGYVPAELETLRALIGAPWMTERGLFHSVPPVYAEHIAAQMTAWLG